MKTKARHENKGHFAYDIFTTSSSGRAQHIESVGTVAVARQHLNQLARSAVGIVLFIPRTRASSNCS
jgi:hypothetical protein